MYCVFLSAKLSSGSVDFSFRVGKEATLRMVFFLPCPVLPSAGAEHVTAIAHVIARHEQFTGEDLEVTSGSSESRAELVRPMPSRKRRRPQAKKAGDALGNIVEHAKLIGEVLEVLAHTEEVRGQGVVKQEVLDLPLDIAATRVGVVLQPAAVAHPSVEHLAGGEV